VAANIMPSEMHTLARLCLDGDFVTAGKLQLYLKDFCDAMFCEVNPIPVKTAMNLLGWEVGGLRLPLCEPEPKQLDRIRKTLEQYALLDDANA
jgi:4-hydroxy-tetrahydrodipicolinate synthase